MAHEDLNNARVSRRAFLGAFAGFGAVAISGCAAMPERVAFFRPRDPRFGEPAQPSFGYYDEMYAAREDEGFMVPAVDLTKVQPQYLRQVVAYPTPEPVGTVIVDTANRYLYLVQENDTALRYGVGIGRDGFEWSGRARIQWKQKWPRWTPPDSMIARQPELAQYSAQNGGKAPGLDNPLGARALYIFQDGVDTLYRIHGTPEYWTIGKAVSSGCVRMMHQDVIDLYDRVPNRTPIIVL
ncbi:MAG TPA: L,D-transpeptidase [Rhizobiaceae bacterium]|nr:L,D-transpeptidase [Rhizobiaceae bacterium]